MFTRNCPSCNCVLTYTTSSAKNLANRVNASCRACAAKKRGQIYKEKFKGSGNPFYGKKHTEETKYKLKQADKSYTKTEEFRNKISKISKEKGCGGRQYYNTWIKLFGIEGAKEREQIRKEKLSKAMSGKNNPMFGKSSPEGSGNGWKGWYKGWFFRSLLELSYMINVIEKDNLKWMKAEADILTIPYTYNGKERTYRADFLINDTVLVEIKPQKLIDGSELVKTKAKAAIDFCKAKGLEYRLISCDKLSTDKLLELYENNSIIFTDRYELKFLKRYYKDD